MFGITNKQSDEYIIKMQKVFYDIENKRVPDTIPEDVRLSLHFTNPAYMEVMYYRDRYIEQVGFARISKEWVRPLAKWIGKRKCLEIMAGSGALSYALKNEGVRVVATDDFSWGKPFKPWLRVENLDCILAIEKYGAEVDFIICSWPYMDDTAYRVLLKMREINPKCRLIYIGEGYGGCTADELFFDEVVEDNVKGFYKAVENFSSWEGIHDNLILYK